MTETKKAANIAVIYHSSMAIVDTNHQLSKQQKRCVRNILKQMSLKTLSNYKYHLYNSLQPNQKRHHFPVHR